MKAQLTESDYKVKTVPIAVMEKTYTADQVKTLCKKAGITYQAGDEANVVTFEASNQTPDREGDIILMSGIDFTDFKKNPVFQWVHDLQTVPIGAVIDLQVDKADKKNPRLLATCIFQQVTETARDLGELVRLGYLKAVSIGFRNKRGGIKFPSESERDAMGMIPGGVVHTACDLIELSLCPVGMNQAALRVRSINSKTIALLKGVPDATIPQEAPNQDDLDMKPEDVKKLVADGIADAAPAFATALAGEIKKILTPAPAGEPPPPAPVPPPAAQVKAWTPFQLAHPEIFGRPELSTLEAINAKLAGTV